MMDKEELKDILDCIIKFDNKETLEVKGAYFEVIQRDLRIIEKYIKKL